MILLVHVSHTLNEKVRTKERPMERQKESTSYKGSYLSRTPMNNINEYTAY
jgi:hypothetical protein